MAMTMKISFVVLMLASVHERAQAQSFLFPGASVMFESGLSQTNTRGAAAVASNPANTVISKRLEAYADLTIVNVAYSYVRGDSDPAKIALSAPPVNFGVSYKAKPNFAFGIFSTPRPSLTATKIRAVPIDMGGTVLQVDIEQKSSTFITAMGAGFKTSKDLALGISIIETAEDSQIIVRDTGTTDDANALLGMEAIKQPLPKPTVAHRSLRVIRTIIFEKRVMLPEFFPLVESTDWDFLLYLENFGTKRGLRGNRVTHPVCQVRHQKRRSMI